MNCGLKKQDVEYILSALRSFSVIEQATIFGSRAMGNYKPGSDVDIAVKGKNITDTTVSRLSSLLNEELPLPYFFDVVHYESIENKELKRHIDAFGLIFEQIEFE